MRAALLCRLRAAGRNRHATPNPLAIAVDAFSDGTPVSGADTDIDDLPASTWLALLASPPPKRRIDPNPAAGTVHEAERSAVWRRAGEAAVAAETRKAAPVIDGKRYVKLGRQLSQGLLTQHGVTIDAASLAVRLKHADKLRARLAKAEAAYAAERAALDDAHRREVAAVVAAAREAALAVAVARLQDMQAAAETARAASPRQGKGRKAKAVLDPELERVANLSPEALQAEAAAEAEAVAGGAGAEVAAPTPPPRPQHTAAELKQVQLAEAAFAFNLPRVLKLLGLQSRQKLDRTMTQLPSLADPPSPGTQPARGLP